ncbi:serine/arginine repetitive matrix protein 1 [Triticum aestivum]|uniref:serine/arginine repetitive matrix protein 1 n=1 Tax=Triticum aestivum TaxID=4565 RepID=UPI001D02D514|nr:serine/arginine repetitive matrix protein 1-like [Triticum aestivum]
MDRGATSSPQPPELLCSLPEPAGVLVAPTPFPSSSSLKLSLTTPSSCFSHREPWSRRLELHDRTSLPRRVPVVPRPPVVVRLATSSSLLEREPCRLCHHPASLVAAFARSGQALRSRPPPSQVRRSRSPSSSRPPRKSGRLLLCFCFEQEVDTPPSHDRASPAGAVPSILPTAATPPNPPRDLPCLFAPTQRLHSSAPAGPASPAELPAAGSGRLRPVPLAPSPRVPCPAKPRHPPAGARLGRTQRRPARLRRVPAPEPPVELHCLRARKSPPSRLPRQPHRSKRAPPGASSSLARPSPELLWSRTSSVTPNGHFVSLVAAVDSQAAPCLLLPSSSSASSLSNPSLSQILRRHGCPPLHRLCIERRSTPRWPVDRALVPVSGSFVRPRRRARQVLRRRQVLLPLLPSPSPPAASSSNEQRMRCRCPVPHVDRALPSHAWAARLQIRPRPSSSAKFQRSLPGLLLTDWA